MVKLEGPVELLELAEGESAEFRVLRWERGELEIRPRHAPAGKIVDAVRLYVPPEDKPAGAPYYDITAGTTIARLLPVLNNVVAAGQRLRFTKRGVPPSARHEVAFL